MSFKLRAVARSREWTTEQAIAPIVGMDPGHPAFAAELGAVLDAIDRAEDAEGRPLLSAVVVVRATGMPSATFFAFARERARHGGADDGAVWERELQRVHDYWYRH